MNAYTKKEFFEKIQEILLLNLKKLKEKKQIDKELLDDLYNLEIYEKKNKNYKNLKISEIIFFQKKLLLEKTQNFIRISYKTDLPHQNDFLINKFIRTISQNIEIFLKEKKNDYNFSLLFTNENLENFEVEFVIKWILDFIENFDQYIFLMKNKINHLTKLAIGNITDSLKA